MSCPAPALLLVVLVACASEPEPQPFRGPAPRSIAILPIRAPELSPDLRRSLDEGARIALADRGYAVIPPEVVGPTLDPSHPLDREVLAGFRRDFGVDAVLEATGAAEPGQLAGGGRPFEVRWTILSTADGKVLWARREIGGPGVVTSRHVVGPQGRYEPDPFFTDEPVSGRGNPGWVTEVKTGGAMDQADAVQRALAARLPEAPRQ